MNRRDRINLYIQRYLPDDKIPSAYTIWLEGRERFSLGDVAGARSCERLNYVLHNSYIVSETKIGHDVEFGYGGIGLVIHPSVVIGRGAMVGANVTLGGKSHSKPRPTPLGRLTSLPVLEDYCYVATGAKIIGAVTVGKLAIVGANSVVTKDVPPLAIVAGSPARQIGCITVENCLEYKSTFVPLRKISDERFFQMVKELAPK